MIYTETNRVVEATIVNDPETGETATIERIMSLEYTNAETGTKVLFNFPTE